MISFQQAGVVAFMNGFFEGFLRNIMVIKRLGDCPQCGLAADGFWRDLCGLFQGVFRLFIFPKLLLAFGYPVKHAHLLREVFPHLLKML